MLRVPILLGRLFNRKISSLLLFFQIYLLLLGYEAFFLWELFHAQIVSVLKFPLFL